MIIIDAKIRVRFFFFTLKIGTFSIVNPQKQEFHAKPSVRFSINNKANVFRQNILKKLSAR